MKKGTKILLGCLTGAALLTSIGFNIALSIKTNSLEGSVIPVGVNEDWKKNSVNIAVGETYKKKCYSGNKNEVKNILFSKASSNSGDMKISFKTDFGNGIDLESYFVFDTGYKTEIHTTYDSGEDEIILNAQIAQANNLYSAHITEVWLRSVLVG